MDSLLEVLRAQEPEETILKAFEDFNETYQTNFDVKTLWTKKQKTLLIKGTMSQLSSWPVKLQVSALSCMKIMCRSYTDIDALYSKQTVGYLLWLSTADLGKSLSEEALKVLLNMCIIQQTTALKLFHELEDTPAQEKSGGYRNLLHLYKENKLDMSNRHILSRVLFYVTFDETLVMKMINEDGLYTILADRIISDSRMPENFKDLDDSKNPESNARRVLVSYGFRMLFNLVMEESRPNIDTKLDTAKYDMFSDCMLGLLGLGVGRDFPPEWDLAEEKTDGSSSTLLMKRTRKRLRGIVPLSEDPLEQDPNITTMYELKCDIANAIIYLSKRVKDKGPESADFRAMYGLCELLDRQTWSASKDTKKDETLLTPMMMALTGVIKESPPAREYVKRWIFGDLAHPLSNADKKLIKESKMGPKDEKMEPEGPSTKCKAEKYTLRTILISYILTFKFNLKALVSEFLWNVAGEEASEYIRLVGFGCAIGLLADKGLPGFTGLTEKAYNVDDLLASGKKL